MRWWYPFLVDWINIALILYFWNRKVTICRDFLSVCRSTGGTPRLHEVTISICSWMNKYSDKSKYFKPKVFICRDFLSLYRSTGGFHGLAHSVQVIACTKSDLTRCRLRLSPGYEITLPYTNQCNYWYNCLSMRAYLKFVLEKVAGWNRIYLLWKTCTIEIWGTFLNESFQNHLALTFMKTSSKLLSVELNLQEVNIYTTSLEGKYSKLRISTSCLFWSILLLI